MCWVWKSIEFARRWYWRQNVQVRCIVKITVVGFIYMWLYVTSGDLNSSQLLTPTENPNTPWCKKKGLRQKRIRWKEFHLNVLCLWFAELIGGLWAKKALGERGTRHGMWNSHNSLPVPDLTLTITWKRLDDYHFLLKWYFGFFDWTDSFTQPSTASRNYFHTRNWNHVEMMDTCTCYPTKWTSIGNNVSVKTANSTTNKRTSFAGCVAMKKLIIKEYIYIILHGRCRRTIFTHEFVFIKRTSAALLCLNNSCLSTVVRKVKVVKTGLLSHCFH